ncbi:MAG: NAD(P)/FAD-dependent oxidoreductase [Pirellulaceae bacterium]|nr:NAD(P)/FAD-dependent oxidoreductase [Pirellulaceae bacterium]
MQYSNSKLSGTYDLIVIGGGHNGLTTAAYLAKAGWRVLVVERRSVLGGCSVTEPLWPGYRVSTASYVVSLLLPKIIRDLKLKENGLKILPRNPSSFTPSLDGRYLLLGPDFAENQRQISKFSPQDAQAYPRYEALLGRVAEAIEPILQQPAIDLLPLPSSWRRIGWLERLKQLNQARHIQHSLKQLGSQLPEAIEILTGAARPILERWFESDIVRATLATDAIIGAFASISSPGTAYVLLHHVMGTAGGARGVWGYIQGGMGGLAEALAATCRQTGVDILTDAPVSRIHANSSGVSGVELADGRSFDCRVVASSIDCNWTFNHLLQGVELPDEFRAAIGRIDYSSASMKVNLAVGEPPRFSCLNQAGVGPQHHGTMHICDSVQWIEQAYADALCGRPSDKPILEITMPTSVDRTIAPEGKHILSMFVQYAPYRLQPGLAWDDIKEDFGRRCVELLGQYAPNIPGCIEHMQVLSPLDIERIYGLTGGNIFQGAMTMNQLYLMRPVPGWSDHRTPLRGLYLCGAASHPGGGVMGACGRNAAQAILKDGRG